MICKGKGNKNLPATALRILFFALAEKARPAYLQACTFGAGTMIAGLVYGWLSLLKFSEDFREIANSGAIGKMNGCITTGSCRLFTRDSWAGSA